MNLLTKKEYDALMALEMCMFIPEEGIKTDERRALNRLIMKGYATFNSEKKQWEPTWKR